VHPAAGHPQRGVDVEADPQRRPLPRRRDRVDQVEVVRRVDHQRDARGRGLVGGQLAQRRSVDRGVGHHDVRADRVLLGGQPQGLGERIGEHTGEAVAGEDPAQHLPAAHRFAGHADRLAGRPADQVGGVAVERVEVDDRERRVEGGGGPVEPRALPPGRVVGGRGAHPGHRAGLRPPPSMPRRV
jgi:hypothetical protein